MKIRLQRWRDYFFLGIFILFQISSIGNIKYLLALVFAAFYFLWQYQFGAPLTMRGAGKSFCLMLAGMCGLFVITAALQLINGFQSYAVNEAVYFITPLFFVWVYVSMTSRERLGIIIDYMFGILILAFIYEKWQVMSFSNLKFIDFTNSFSVFECGYGYPSVVLECVFLMRGEKKKAFGAMLFAVLCFKRFCMIAAVLIFVFSKWIISDKPADKKVVAVAIIGFVLLPIITCGVLNEEFSAWFEQQFGISLRLVTMSRSDRLIAVINSDEIKHGLGSTTVYMTDMLNELHGSEIEQRNLHNDLVRIYLECGILGSIIFTYTYFKATIRSQTALIIMCYVFAECYFNHLLGAGTVGTWILVCTVLAYLTTGEQAQSQKATKAREFLKQ